MVVAVTDRNLLNKVIIQYFGNITKFYICNNIQSYIVFFVNNQTFFLECFRHTCQLLLEFVYYICNIKHLHFLSCNINVFLNLFIFCNYNFCIYKYIVYESFFCPLSLRLVRRRERGPGKETESRA